MPIMPTNLLDQIANTGYDAIYGGYAAGLYELPDEFTKPYGELTKDVTGKDADKLWGQCCRTMGYRGAEIITEYLRPAFDQRAQRFADDIALLGHFADLQSPTTDLLAAGDQVREAYLRHTHAHDWYLPIRAAWRGARRRDTSAGDCPDPHGVDSALAEFANVPEVVPEWKSVGGLTARGFVSAPWERHGTAAHARLAWAVRHGLAPWIPTAAEHAEAWLKYNPVVPRGVDPRAVSHSTTTA